LLTQGELNLKQYVAQRDQTNRLAAALQNFNQLLATHSTAPDLVGRAFLDRGWCYWLQDNYATALPDFQAATAKLPVSPEQAVARFKVGDAEFALGHFPAAITNYQAVLDHFSHLPDVRQSLDDRALYQIVRASVKLQDAATAEKAMRRLLADFPKSDLGENAELLLGEGLSSFDAPTNAVQVFRDFVKRFPDSPLRPQAELDVARTYEREQNWPAAIASYQNWLAAFPTNQQTELRAQAEYSLAWSEYQSGNETNALSRFTAFVSQYPTSPLAPVAQWWVADYYFRQGGTSYSEAEKNYEYIFQNTNTVWQQSSLFYPAQLMAARAAVGRQDYQGAVNFYLTRLLSDTNCPAPLQRQAKFAYGGVLMRWDSPDTNRPYLNFETASNVFAELGADNATNQYGPLAWSELGDCNLQLGALPAATNAYTRAMNSPSASVGLRCRAQVGLGRVLEKMAENAAADSDRQALLQQALKNYLAVFQTSMGNGLNDNESPQAFWVAKAGLLMLPLLSKDGHYPANFFDRMESLLPQLKDSLEKKKAALAAENN
jgi:TolA-binding protein